MSKTDRLINEALFFYAKVNWGHPHSDVRRTARRADRLARERGNIMDEVAAELAMPGKIGLEKPPERKEEEDG